jgi:hypothetical protein
LPEPPHGGVVGERDVDRAQSRAVVDVHLARTVDEHVGHAHSSKQLLQRACAHDVAAKRVDERQHGGIGQHPAFAPQGRRHIGGRDARTAAGQPSSDAVDERCVDHVDDPPSRIASKSRA